MLRNNSRIGRLRAGNSSGSSDFSPASIAGLVFWIDAADTSTITDSGGLVSQWDDKSGNNNDNVQGTVANQPITNASTLNSKNVIDFDGIDAAIAALPAASINDIFSGGATVFSVINPISDGGGNAGRIVCKARNFINVQNEVGAGVRLTVFMEFNLTNGFWATDNTDVTLNTGNITTVTYDSDSIVNDPIIYINGTSRAFTEITTPTGTKVSDSLDNQVIGNRSSLDRCFDGSIAEVLIYNTILTASQRNEVLQYLSPKWGVALA